ncbi:catechol 1,2-dioxygenase [Burkholderia singularis]|uniref:catechol 1,2-dioxygenase n=1 Tax=Burkholderia singularis TaxID=1503053 RepID=A0A118DM87_9BURK|nr:catechol 1,2-dioxygenase [Burkholderia singularis]KVE24544.1 catechol 1,2-dioxygenase [Burkholderia singularis]
MSIKIATTPDMRAFAELASGLTSEQGSPRAKQIVHRLLTDLFKAIDDLDITPDEVWAGIAYLNDLGAAGEAGLLAAGLGLEHYLDVRMDAQDAAAGIETGTSRTIEGPLYVGGAPLSDGAARLDDGTDAGRTLIMHGVVRNLAGEPVRNAIVDVWHANTKGMYSFFDKSQSRYNLRRRIRTGADGRYEFRSILPSGYGCPPDGPTQHLLNQIGRHGQRPAHIHFFVSAPGHRQLTTQINIAGDAYLHDDFAFATRDDLIADIVERSDAASLQARGLSAPFAEIAFDFVITPLDARAPDGVVQRRRVEAA